MRSGCRRGRGSGSRVPHGDREGEGLSLLGTARVSSRLPGFKGHVKVGTVPHIHTRFMVNGRQKGSPVEADHPQQKHEQCL